MLKYIKRPIFYFSLMKIKFKIIFIFTLILLVLSCLYTNPRTLRRIKILLQNNISCYRDTSLPSLPDILKDDPPRGRSIFFHETSCTSMKEKRITLSSRQACAVESAARLNPNFRIYILFTSPGTIQFENNRNDLIIKQLMSYDNVRIKHLNFKKYISGSPVEELYNSFKIEASTFSMSHASDVLRYLTLWRYGGIYLDLDVVLIKSLEKLKPNFAGRESGHAIAAGAIGFAHEGDGHKWARQCLQDLKSNFDGDDWGNNGPGVITRLTKKLCGDVESLDMSQHNCQGFSVYPPSTFYPIPWRNWTYYFDERHLNDVLHMFKNTTAIHVWNKFSIERKIKTGSNVPYEYFAKKFCPKVYAVSGEEF